jgi:hypothetical protein
MENGGEIMEAPRQQRSDLSKLLVFFFHLHDRTDTLSYLLLFDQESYS